MRAESPAMLDRRLEGVGKACAEGRCADAVHLLEKAVQNRPGDFALYYRLGICHAGACRPHQEVHPDLAAQYFRQALRLSGDNADLTRAVILDALGDVLRRSRTVTAVTALQASIDCLREAAAIYRSLGMPGELARTQFNLGNCFCDVSEIAGEDRWHEAVGHYEEALRVRTRDHDPERHAALLENLGSAYRRLSSGGPGDNVKQSIRCYQRALRICPPCRSAALHCNLGNAYLSLPGTGEGSAARNARRALRHFDRALGLQSRDPGSRAYGITQYNRALAFHRLQPGSPGAAPEGALACLEKAVAAFESCGEVRYMQLARAQLDRIARQ